MKLSHNIERFLKAMLDECNGTLEIQRNELANQFNCVPSQISYVISTRFTNECGYVVESKRGGGGYIKITRVEAEKENYFMHAINSIGDSISWQTTLAIVQNCVDYRVLSERESRIVLSVLNDNALGIVQQPERDKLRAKLLKGIFINLVE